MLVLNIIYVSNAEMWKSCDLNSYCIIIDMNGYDQPSAQIK